MDVVPGLCGRQGVFPLVRPHPFDQLAQGIFRHKGVFKYQRPAYAAPYAGGPFKEVQVVQPAVFDLLQYVDHIVDAIHRQDVIAVQSGALAAIVGPVDPLPGGVPLALEVFGDLLLQLGA